MVFFSAGVLNRNKNFPGQWRWTGAFSWFLFEKWLLNLSVGPIIFTRINRIWQKRRVLLKFSAIYSDHLSYLSPHKSFLSGEKGPLGRWKSLWLRNHLRMRSSFFITFQTNVEHFLERSDNRLNGLVLNEGLFEFGLLETCQNSETLKSCVLLLL